MSHTVEAELASQYVSNIIFIPCSVGWCISLVLCGIATDRAVAILRRSSRRGNKIIGGTTWARPLLIAAVIANILSAATVYWDIVAWMTTQHRTEEEMLGFKIPDVIQPLFAGLVGAIVQTFMAIRCWRLLNRSIWFGVVVAMGISLTLAGAVWSVVTSYAFTKGANFDLIFVPTQIWLWTSSIVDIMITSSLIYHLAKMKQGFNESTDMFLDSLIRLSFETCLAPSFFSVLSAILYAVFVNTDYLWNMFIATSAFIPSLYVLSFVYCLEGTARSRRRLETSKGGTGPAARPVSLGVPGTDARKGTLARSPTKSFQWDPPLGWESSVVQEDKDLPVRRPSLAFHHYADASTYEPASFGVDALAQPDDEEKAMRATDSTRAIIPTLSARATARGLGTSHGSAQAREPAPSASRSGAKTTRPDPKRISSGIMIQVERQVSVDDEK